jgi:hypothetical protein
MITGKSASTAQLDQLSPLPLPDSVGHMKLAERAVPGGRSEFRKGAGASVYLRRFL